MREGLPVIKQAEGLKLKAYLCPAGVPTIGYGETRNVKLGMTITEQQAESMLIASYDLFEAKVKKLVKVKLSDNQLGALVSFAYNLGTTSLQNSTLLKLVNQGKYKAASEAFGKWVYARVPGKSEPQVLPGLVKRRQAEKELFLKP